MSLARRRDPESLTRRAAAFVRAGVIPPPAGDAGAEKLMLAAVAVLADLHDRAGVRDGALLQGAFVRLMDDRHGAPLVETLLADAIDGHPVCIVTHWATPDGRAATSIYFRTSADIDKPIPAPSGDEWEAKYDGVLSLAPLWNAIIESRVIPFRERAH